MILHYSRAALSLVLTTALAYCLSAQTFVTSTADSGPGSLRDAVRDARSGELIFFDSALDGATIQLTDGPIRITQDVYIYGSPSRKVRIQGTGRDRLVDVEPGSRMDLSGVVLAGGKADAGGAIRVDRADVRLIDTDIEDSRSDGAGGGALYGRDARVDLQRVKMMRNTAMSPDGRGGAVLLDGTSKFSADDSDFADNEATKSGGAIEDASAAGAGATLTGSRFSGNKADKMDGAGGAICISGGADYTISGTTLTGNSAGKGGAVYAKDSRVSMSDADVSDNRSRSGGGVYNDNSDMDMRDVAMTKNVASGDDSAGGGGGGLVNDGGRTLIAGGSKVNDNSASGDDASGGGIKNVNGGSLDIYDTQIAGNDATTKGGGIDQDAGPDGRLLLVDSDVRANRAKGKRLDGNARNPDRGGFGGGVSVGPDAVLTAKNVDFFDNSAQANGGAIYGNKGQVTLDDSELADNEAAGADDGQGGGGVYNDGGGLTLTNSVRFRGNKASGLDGSGGGVFNGKNATSMMEDADFDENLSSRSGGAIEDRSGADGTLTMRRVRVKNNRATRDNTADGGGLSVKDFGNAVIEDSDFVGNVAGRDGGGIYSANSNVTLRRSNVADNRADGAGDRDGGGGIYNDAGLLEVLNSAVYRNAVKGARATGGGIYNADGELMMKQSTVGENTSDYDFGGIANDGNAFVSGSTIAKNRSARRGGGIGLGANDYDLEVRGSIVAKNVAAGTGMGQDLDRASGNFRSGGYNLVGNDDGFVFTNGTDDQVGSGATVIDPIMDDLAQIPGRRTPTYKLLCGSPARDKGDPLDFEVDQDGKPVFNGRRDIGAYEADDFCATLPRSGGLAAAAPASYGVFPNPAAGAELTVRLQSGDPTAQRDLQLVNPLGQVVREGRFVGEQTFIPISDLVSGIYQVRVREGESSETFSVEVR